MSDNQANTKRIAKNTLMLYVRMLFSMLVSLYTSRVVLNTLGVEDYGIYNVVGGVVAMVGFLNASMSGATSRFITYELGRGDLRRLKETFSSALFVHTGIALVVFVLAETIGLWFLECKLVIPDARMDVARVVYQLSILGTVLGIIQSPFNACIISHEKMNVYAYVEMLNVCLRLVVIYILVIGNVDKLLLFSILQLCVSVLIMCIYQGYCYKNYDESHFCFVWNKKILKPLLGFSGWDLYGNASVMLRVQGVNMLLNMFFGPIVNAAGAIAASLTGVVMSFTGNIFTAFRPAIVKSYAGGDMKSMFLLSNQCVRISYSLFLMLAIPMLVETEYVLQLWLGEVPIYSVAFCRIMIITNCFTALTQVLNISIHATGKIRMISFLSGTLIWLAVPIIYILLRKGFGVNTAYICNGFVSFMIVFLNAFILKYLLNQFSYKEFFIGGVFRCLMIGGAIYILLLGIVDVMQSSLIRCILSFLLSGVITVGLGWFLLIDSEMRYKMKQKIASYVERF